MAQTTAPAAQTDRPNAQAGKDQTTTTGQSTTDKRGDSKGMQPSGGGPNTKNMGSQAGGGSGGSGGGK